MDWKPPESLIKPSCTNDCPFARAFQCESGCDGPFLTVVFCRGIINDTYKMDLILVHSPHLITLACIFIASVQHDKEITAWFEELHVDMNVVSHPNYLQNQNQSNFFFFFFPYKVLICLSALLYFAGAKHCNGDFRFLRELQSDVRRTQD